MKISNKPRSLELKAVLHLEIGEKNYKQTFFSLP